MKYKKIVVTGGSGMVGRSLKDIMPEAIYLSSKDYNLTSEKHVAQLFFDHNPDCIIHLAAKVGGIIDNINKPAEYFTDNILMNTLLVDYAVKNNVKRFNIKKIYIPTSIFSLGGVSNFPSSRSLKMKMNSDIREILKEFFKY